MMRFICMRNITHFDEALQVETDPDKRRILEMLLNQSKAELATLNAEQAGAQRSTSPLREDLRTHR